MAISKITTSGIAGDTLTAADIAANAVGTSELADSAVTGVNIAYLGDGSGNLSGTITNQQLHFGTTFTLTDDLTINGDVTLGKVRDDGLGQSITGDGKTLSGTGTLTMGSSVEGEPKNRTNERASAFGDITTGDITTGDITTTGNATASGNLTVSGDIVPSTPLSHRNLIINGGMQVWQRATATTTATTGSYITADRWNHVDQSGGTFTSERDALSVADKGTTGQAYALELNVTGADASVASGDYCKIEQIFEGQNLQHLGYGSSSAKDLVLSFWVKSNKTGTYGTNLQKQTNTTYYCIREYTIDVADTWEKKILTFSPTAGSTSLITASPAEIDDTNAAGMRLAFWLMGGTSFHVADNTWSTGGHTTSNHVNWMDSTSNNFYITGVQLELGSNATPFEHRSFAEELVRCQRYYYAHYPFGSAANGLIGKGAFNNSSQFEATVHFHQTMRTKATLILNTGTNYFRIHFGGGSVEFNDLGLHADSNPNCTSVYKAGLSGTIGYGGNLVGLHTSASVHFNAEL